MSATVDLIQKLYIGYFGRAGDPSGLQYWVERKTAGMTDAAIAQSFSVQTEATAMYGFLAAPSLGMGQDAFLEAVYQNLFERSIEADGLTYWKGQLANGRPVGGIILDIINGAVGGDATTVANKLSVANYYTEAVLNANATWTLADDQADAIAVIASVTSDTATVATGEALADALLASDTAPAGQSFTLTTGVDQGAAFTGGAGADTFNGTAGTTTLNALDSLDGGNGTDTLNYIQTAAISVTSATAVRNIELANITSGADIALDASGWTGLTSLVASAVGGAEISVVAGANVTLTDSNLATHTIDVDGAANVTIDASKVTTGTISVGTNTAVTGAVNVSSALISGGGASAITVVGGTSVTVAQSLAAGATNTTGAVDITNDGALTTVSATATKGTGATITYNTVQVNGLGSAEDADTITSISASGYTTFTTAHTNNLSTLQLGTGSGNITIDNGDAGHAATTLALSLNGLTGGCWMMMTSTPLSTSPRPARPPPWRISLTRRSRR